MRDEEKVAQPSCRPNFKAIKFFLLGVGLEVAPVCVFLLWFVIEAPPRFCGGRTLGGCFWQGLVVFVHLVLFFMMYFWYILVPALLLPPAVGLVMDYRRYDLRPED